ncbi:MAG: GAF domain-containing protein [Bacteroidota bacterium]
MSVKTSDHDQSVTRVRDEADLLRMVAEATTQLLRTDDAQPAIARVLERVGEALQADRMVVYRLQSDPGAPPRAQRRHQWVRAGLPDTPSAFQGPTLTQWSQSFARGEQVHASTEAFPCVHQGPVAEAPPKTLMVVPIRTREQIWGFLWADRTRDTALWGEDQADVLHTVAATLGAAVERVRRVVEPVPGEGVLPAVVAEQLQNPPTDITDPFLVMDAEGAVIFLNQVFSYVFGYALDELERLDGLSDLLVEADEPLRHALTQQQAASGTAIVQTAQGRPLPVHLVLDTILDDQGAVQYLLCICTLEAYTAQDTRFAQDRVEHRLRVEASLVQASQTLVSSGDVDLDAVLALMGEAVRTETAYLITFPLNPAAYGAEDEQPLDINLNVWHRDGTPSEEWIRAKMEGDGPLDQAMMHRFLDRIEDQDQAEPTTVAVPVLSTGDRLYGYIGFEYGTQRPTWFDEDVRMLNVLGDLLATYFERRSAERALRASEERYRTFVDTINEAIWRISLDSPVDVALPEQVQQAQITEHGRIAECNRAMATLLGCSAYEAPLGEPIAALGAAIGDEWVRAFIETGYRLKGREYSVEGPSGRERDIVLNVVGTFAAGKLVEIWGSCMDVTERVQLERRMVNALEDQQQRIGRDLHDGVGQLLTGIRMLSTNLAERLLEADEAAYEKARRVAQFAQDASQRVREIYRGLTPAQLFHEGLFWALQEMASNVNALPDVTCQLIHDGVTDIHERDQKLHLYRIAQEAVNNALKHADAEVIRITLKRRRGHVFVRVEDDGQGFVIRPTRGNSLGLDGMHYRARVLRAQLTIDSEPGAGTIIECILTDTERTDRS